jgi:hypothetical protein
MDWREIGRRVRERWERHAASASVVDMTSARDISHAQAQFYQALMEAGRGETALIIYHLRSGEPLPDDFRESLADYFEGRFRHKPPAHRPKQKRERIAAKRRCSTTNGAKRSGATGFPNTEIAMP